MRVNDYPVRVAINRPRYKPPGASSDGDVGTGFEEHAALRAGDEPLHQGLDSQFCSYQGEDRGGQARRHQSVVGTTFCDYLVRRSFSGTTVP